MKCFLFNHNIRIHFLFQYDLCNIKLQKIHNKLVNIDIKDQIEQNLNMITKSKIVNVHNTTKLKNFNKVHNTNKKQ